MCGVRLLMARGPLWSSASAKRFIDATIAPALTPMLPLTLLLSSFSPPTTGKSVKRRSARPHTMERVSDPMPGVRDRAFVPEAGRAPPGAGGCCWLQKGRGMFLCEGMF